MLCSSWLGWSRRVCAWPMRQEKKLLALYTTGIASHYNCFFSMFSFNACKYQVFDIWICSNASPHYDLSYSPNPISIIRLPFAVLQARLRLPAHRYYSPSDSETNRGQSQGTFLQILYSVGDTWIVIRDPKIIFVKTSSCAISFYHWQNFYGERLGKIYIVHANWLFWSGFFLILKPLLGLVSRKSDKILLLSDAKGRGNDMCDLQGPRNQF